MNLTPLEAELLEGLELTVDLIKKYDTKLIQMGEPRELVYSEIHKKGIQKLDLLIRRTIAQRSQLVPD